jgi:signal transduction histidine kinase
MMRLTREFFVLKARLPLIVVVLVVIPTAILSIIAARSLKADELIVKGQQQLTAETAVAVAADQIAARLANVLEYISGGMRECLAGGGEIERIRTTAKRLQDSRQMADAVYLYMDPWGFVWPEKADEFFPGAVAPEGAQRMLLDDVVLTMLRSEIAAKPGGSAPVAFTLDGNQYLFARMGGRNFYAGFRLDVPTLHEWLMGVISLGSRAGVQLHVTGPDIALRPVDEAGAADVAVTDSLGGSESVVDVISEFEATPLARKQLSAPLSEYTIAAHAHGVASLINMRRSQSRLYAWTIILLAGGIIAGVALVIGGAAVEVRRAKSKADFVIGISHDLRTPIASVKMMAESLFMGSVVDEAKRKLFLKTIIDQSDRLQQLVERVLFFVRFGQNALHMHKAEVDICLLVNDAVTAYEAGARHTLSASAAEAGAGLVDVTLLDRPGWVEVDAQAVEQVILNLLDNAQKYGALDKSEDVDAVVERISLTVERAGNDRSPEVHVAVCDRGPGVPPKEISKIFNQFYRAQETSDKNLSGVGLGLALCKHVIEAHGGRIRADNRPEGGLRVWFALPLLRESS